MASEKKGNRGWILRGICLSLLCAVLLTSAYGFLQNQSGNDFYPPLESQENIAWIYQSSYLLYHDLYNKVNHTQIGYMELYLSPEPEWEGILDDFCSYYFNGLEDNFSSLNENYDYLIEDLDSSVYTSNLPSPNIELQDQYFYLSFLFDGDGNVTVEESVSGDDPTAIRKNANAVIRDASPDRFLREWLEDDEYAWTDKDDMFRMDGPKNCRVTYCISRDSREKLRDLGDTMPGVIAVYCILLGVLILLGALLPRADGKGGGTHRILERLPPELMVILAYLLLFGGAGLVNLLACRLSSGQLAESLALLPVLNRSVLAKAINVLALTALFFCGWICGVFLRTMRTVGFREYLRSSSLLYRVFFFLKDRGFPILQRKISEVYQEVLHLDVTKNANKMILKVVLLNALVLFGISSLWFGGVGIAVVYSVILYFILRKYVSDLQKKYGILLGAINRIAEGDLNVVISEDLGVFEPFKPQLVRIQNGFRKAVDEEVRSQRMRAELITNVSHDLKTPLTAIITYINLLRDENLTEEQRGEYLDTLERKSLRLRALIEDLFEVSKANSGNLTLNIVDVDIVSLIRQVEFEMADKLEAAQLDVRMKLPEQKVVVPLDSQKTYRIYENLFGNIAKYALGGTRVYVEVMLWSEEVEVVLKNITANEICVQAEELTERFVRGDASRNTEGSGLGLAIAKSFTQLQGGRLRVQVDGDLFKVSTVWKLPRPEREEA